MIETIIKRDGRKEPFDANKLNNWALWGEKTLGNLKDFNWSGIVLRAVATLPKEVSAKELQDTLIRECNNQDSWEGSRFAGRLYASSLPKELYESRKHPHIKDLHKTLIDKNIIVPPNYTEEEYDEINKMLVHRRDYTYSYYSLLQLVHKYSLRDRVNNVSYETPQFIYMRVAMQSLNDYKRDDRFTKLKDLYTYLSTHKINVPTPYFSNSLTSNPNTSSCSVLTSKDTWESIGVMNTLAYALTTLGAGVGSHYKIRSLGDPVRGGTVKHAGKVPYIRAFANIMKSSTQGCYDKETEVLTDNGWKFFKDLTDEDKILQVDENSRTSYVKPIRIFSYQYVGDMYRFYGTNIDLVVTPNHRMVYKNQDKLEVIEADKFKDKQVPVDLDISEDAIEYSLEVPQVEVISDWSGAVYCVEVPSGIIIVRRNGGTAICGNSRSGASTIHFPFFDPEVEVLVSLKNPMSVLANRVRDSDYAISINKWFVKRAFKKEPIWLFSYKDNPELFEQFYTADSEEWGKALEEFATSNPDKVKEINASDLLVHILTERMETGRLYIHFADTSNKQTPFKETIYSSNLCITGDQFVPSNKGLLTAKELYDLGEELVLFDGTKQVKSSPMKLRERQVPVYEITFRNGLSHKVTDYHKVMTNKGLVACKDLDPKVHRLKINTSEGIFGTNHKPEEAYQLGLWHSDNNVGFNYDLDHDNNSLPLWLRQGDRDTHKAYADGLMSNMTKVLAGYTTLYDSDINLLGQIQLLLNNLGIFCSVTSDSYLLFPNQYSNADTSPIKSIVEIGVEDVYCPTVDSEEHLFVANGVITSNCMEISLPTRPFDTHSDLYRGTAEDNGVVAFCNLAGINLPNIKDDEEYYKVAYYSLFMIDKGIDNSNMPYPALNASLKGYRSAGVGMVGLAYLMAKKGMRYVENSGKQFIHDQSERFGYFLTKAAIDLTKEFGLSELSHLSKYSEGWLPIDDAPKALDELVDTTLKYDWEALRKEMIDLKGLRFSTLTSNMPAESSSVSCSMTNSIFPVRSLMINKTSGNTTTKWVAPESTRLAKKYEIVWNVPNEDLIKCYGLIQRFIDQGMSSDTFYDRSSTADVPMSQLFKEIALGAKYGLKSFYYANTKLVNSKSMDFLEAKDDSPEMLEEVQEDGCGSGGCTL